ncbi:uncharacterized protein LOC124306494 [Neodiprion virginianus]|uniref:uncharacterized protein LOC124306494 n=1 Tax=Neodiprion virginianus TaxID=2961670 RepID=UPI001EE6B099|nr:uncharacterized protein LOC124306494 [Neodiprion virginianus]
MMSEARFVLSFAIIFGLVAVDVSHVVPVKNPTNLNQTEEPTVNPEDLAEPTTDWMSTLQTTTIEPANIYPSTLLPNKMSSHSSEVAGYSLPSQGKLACPDNMVRSSTDGTCRESD